MKQAVLEKNLNKGKTNIRLSQPDVASQEIFNSAKNVDKQLTFRILNENGSTKYAWIFNNKEIRERTIDVNLALSLDAEPDPVLAQFFEQENAIAITFRHRGSLPAPATIKLYVGDRYKDGTVLNLYSYDAASRAIADFATDLVVSGGYLEFPIEHC
ncbi:hypothetical protein CLOSTMETH_02084 [[Clostridium] methylpentosum DSM 5476]|uniref:Uncharacterized protein n=1 Tax=[Clostridium] methylpentosum DSM 5476 TaxID=537013 RepID=C0EE05_9FIRM|nr:hypothetical protein CLOSTMETH_02084 [[Clostridium] methylpentosum DSM 5476]MDY3988431.1 hypothetical protein [Massilioclostridium sp.]